MLLAALLAWAMSPATADAQQQSEALTRAAQQTGVKLGIPRAQTTPALDGSIDENEWRDAFAITGVVNQFDVMLSPHQATFWVKYDDGNLYLAVRSETRPEAMDENHKPVMPVLWMPKGDDSVIVALAPQANLIPPLPTYEPNDWQRKSIANGTHEPVPTYTPSHTFMRLTPLDEQRLMRFVSQIDGVAWRYPHQQGMIEQLQRGSSYDADARLWSVEYVIPLASLGVQGQVDGSTWGMLLGRDYPHANQNAIAMSNDWRFGIWSPGREHSIDFWNFYQDRKDYAPADFLGKAPAVQLLELGDVASGQLSPRMSLYNPTDEAVELNVHWKVLGAYGLGPQVNQKQTIRLASGQHRKIDLEAVVLESEITSELSLQVTDARGRVFYSQKLPARAGYGQQQREPALPELAFHGAFKNNGRNNIRAFMNPYDPIAERFWANIHVPVKAEEIDDVRRIRGVDLIVRARGQSTPSHTVSLTVNPEDTFAISHGQGYRVRDAPGHVAGEYHPTRLATNRKDIIPGEFRLQTDAPKLQPGVYELTARLIDSQGKAVAESRRYFMRRDHEKELPWLGNEIGLGDEILAPWTPIESSVHDGKADVSVWGRKYTLNAGSLIDNITVLDEPILAAPMQIQIKRGDQWESLSPQGDVELVSDKPHEAHLRGQLAGSGFKASTQSRMAYDGYLSMDITLTPDTQKAVDAMRVRIPIDSRFATTLHATGGTYMRSSSSILNFDDRDGQLWNSNQARSGGSHRIPYAMGSFMPYVWVGGVDRGIAFTADNDQGWVCLPQRVERIGGEPVYLHTLVPSIEVVREGSATYLVLNIVQRPFEFDKPRTIRFGLQATPIRPLPDDFRARRQRLTLGQPFTGWRGIWDNNGMRLKMEGLSVTAHGARLAPLSWDRHENSKRPNDQYFIVYQAMDGVLPYAELDESVVPGLQGGNLYGYLHPHVSAGQFSPGQENMTRAEADYRIWRYDQWLAKGKALDGLYFDNTFARLSSNIGTGSAYIIDVHDDPELHGSVQPGYAVTSIRQFVKRLRSVFLKHRGQSHIWLHSTDAQMITSFAFADYFLPGENYPSIDKGGISFSAGKITTNKAHMQMYHNPEKWGIVTNHLGMWGKGWGSWHTDPETVAAFREMLGWEQLHDTTSASFMDKMDWRGLDLEKFADFQPYWDPKVRQAIAHDEPELYVSGWKQNGALRMIAFNREKTKRSVTITIDPKLLGLSEPQAGWTAVMLDADISKTYTHGRSLERLNMAWPGDVTGEANVRDGRIVFTFDVNPRDFRLLMIHPKGQPIPFPQGEQPMTLPEKTRPQPR